MKLKSFAKSIKGALAVCCLAVAGTFPTGANASCIVSDEVYIGSVCTTAISFCPGGYKEMSGQMLAISEHSAVFSLLGCKWGGNCQTTFALPDMRGRVPMGVGTGPGLTPRALGERFGQERQQLDISLLPSHTHEADFVQTSQTSVEVNAFDGLGKSAMPTEDYKYLQTVGESPFSASTDSLLYGGGDGTAVSLGGVDVTGPSGVVTVERTGAGKAFKVINPATVLTYCIAIEGLYPPRP